MTAKSSRAGWFTIDVDGLEALAERRPPAWWIHELIQNGLDEDGVTKVIVGLNEVRGRDDVIEAVVIDNAPGGWVNLDEASTMFAGRRRPGIPRGGAGSTSARSCSCRSVNPPRSRPARLRVARLGSRSRRAGDGHALRAGACLQGLRSGPS